MSWSWQERSVDRGRPHLVLSHEDGEDAVATVGPPDDGVFPVQFVAPQSPETAKLRDEVRSELDYYLVEKGEPDPWRYAIYHCGTAANLYSSVHWGLSDPTQDTHSAPTTRTTRQRFGPLVDRAWEIYATSVAAADTATVRPSMPILYFGDYGAFRASPVRIATVGLNPSLEEFPGGAPWSRFPTAPPPEGTTSLGQDQCESYLASLDDYFVTCPYRTWFDGSFEPLLRGAGASYYPGADSTALHTDIASPVPTNPTWSKLGNRRAQHEGGAKLWRDLIESLAPDVLVVSVAREHLRPLETLQTREWSELARIERESPFVVSETEMVFGTHLVLVVSGRCTNVPFGSVSFNDRERIGAAVRSRAETMREERSER